MKVVRTKATKATLATEIDLFSDKPLPARARREATRAIGEFLVDEINASLASAQSPVSGESFPSLSKDYAKEKRKAGFRGVPDLERSGSMKDALEFRETKNGIEIGFFGDRTNAPKADGHNNFSGDSELPQRRFLPAEGQKFKRAIEQEIENILNEKMAESFDISDEDLEEIETQSDLNRFLRETFEGLSRAEAVSAILSSDELFEKFQRAGLLRLLRG